MFDIYYHVVFIAGCANPVHSGPWLPLVCCLRACIQVSHITALSSLMYV